LERFLTQRIHVVLTEKISKIQEADLQLRKPTKMMPKWLPKKQIIKDNRIGQLRGKDRKMKVSATTLAKMWYPRWSMELIYSPFIVSNILISNCKIELADNQPHKFKECLDDIFNDKSSNEEFVIKNIFLYFFELMGIAEKDALEYLCSYITKNHDEKKLLKIFDDDIKISFEKLVFFNSDKKSLA
jgi:hypothetical protein